MDKKPKSSRPMPDELSDWLGNQHEAPKEEFRRIWRDASMPPEMHFDPDEDETEQALNTVLSRINTPENHEASLRNLKSQQTGINKSVIYSIAAALLIFAVGIIWMNKDITVKAPPGQFTDVTLPDGTQVLLNSGSVISYNRFFKIFGRHAVLNGEAYFNVTHDPAHPFTVSANGADVEVLGTQFNVRSWKKDARGTEVTLIKGSVRFSADSHPDHFIMLTPGEKSDLKSPNSLPTTPVQADKASVLAWKEHNLAFTSETLDHIFQTLELRFGKKIQWDGMAAGNRTYTMYFNHPKSLQRVLDDICKASGLRYEQIVNGYRVFPDDSSKR